MLFRSKILFMFFFLAFFTITIESAKECCQQRKLVFSFDHPKVTYFHPEYLGNVTASARRVSRTDFNHYINLSLNIKKTWCDNVTHNLYFYQLLSNVYKPSFVELHFGTCKMLDTDNVVKVVTQKAFYRMPISERPIPTLGCPITPGFYRLERMIVPTSYIPENFPFTEGRLYYNLTVGTMIFGSGHMDFELKTVRY